VMYCFEGDAGCSFPASIGASHSSIPVKSTSDKPTNHDLVGPQSELFVTAFAHIFDTTERKSNRHNAASQETDSPCEGRKARKDYKD
jgi:hypothetical protein